MKFLFCTPEEVQKRQKKCEKCPEYNRKWTKCRQCGCFLTAKWKIVNSKCPKNKWEKIKR